MKHIVFYDGECGFCSSAVQFILRRDVAGRFAFAALQGRVATERLAKHGIADIRMDTFYLVRDVDTPAEHILERSDAALGVASELPWPWRLARVFRLVPRSMRDGVYNLVARHRHRLPGGAAQCLLPTAEQRARFLDVT